MPEIPLCSLFSVSCADLEFMGLFELSMCSVMGFDSRVRRAEFDIYVYFLFFFLKPNEELSIDKTHNSNFDSTLSPLQCYRGLKHNLIYIHRQRCKSQSTLPK
jgi:hypothetical protein